jgi:hypothetical protein
MANLHVTEFFGLASGDQSTDIVMASAEAHLADQVVALTAASVASANFQRETRYIRLVAGGPCSIAVGVGPTAVLGGWFMNTGQELWVRVKGGGTFAVAAITDTP